MVVKNLRILCIGLLMSLNYVQAAEPDLPHMAEPAPTLYTGFGQLLDDDKTLVLEELMDLDQNIQRIALYHNGDRLHRLIPKQVHQMIENKLMRRLIANGRFDVIQCLECRTTKVVMAVDELKISQAAENNQQLRALSKKVRADAFMFWSASVHENKFTINLRLVDGKNNELLWLKEYSKKTTQEAEENDFDRVQYEFIVGAWGVKGKRESTVAAGSTELKGATVFGIRRRESTELNEDIEYTLGFEYFTNYSSEELFDLSGYNLEGRVIADIPALDDVLDTKVYLGIGQSFFNDANSLIFRFGFEFPFFKDGFMDFGVMYMREANVKWKTDAAFEEIGTFGGASYDLTLGVRF
ncbi:Conserved hypothetical protein [Oleispira antarctica RB-8]|uniref:Uncharacterized protein n=1 Tax=Oleispira antarctica RB-8 TaxID=698738 RepID=R4YKB8_OLEAN|nr:Conserved hypothetical protein [Oleispira antarctica RB-8]